MRRALTASLTAMVTAVVALGTPVFGPASQAWAAPGQGGGGAEHVRGVLSAYAVHLSSDDAELRPGAGSLAGSGTPEPPACWFQPASFVLAELINRIWAQWIHAEGDRRAADAWREYWLDQISAHAGGSGHWYHIACRDWSAPAVGVFVSVNPPFLWVPAAGPLPPVAGVIITPEQLAQYARDSIVLPETAVLRNPDARSTVRLDTWVWLDPDVFHPVHVRAEAGPLTVDAVATPSRLLLPTNLPADLTPASGDCTKVFQPYARGAAPSCAITFGRSSTREPGHAFTAEFTVVWTVSWTSNWGPAGTLPDGRLTGTSEIPVQEIQTIVTGGG